MLLQASQACVRSQEDDDEDSSGGAQTRGAPEGGVTRPDDRGPDARARRQKPKMSNLQRFIGCQPCNASVRA